MKPLHEQRKAITGGMGRVGKASIEDEDLPKVLSILSDQLYSNKIAAVIREYSCNAADAHVEQGIPTKPFDVILPTAFVPELVIRDFGPGLCEDAIYGVYMVFGKSTEEHTNTQKGMFLAFSHKLTARPITWRVSRERELGLVVGKPREGPGVPGHARSLHADAALQPRDE